MFPSLAADGNICIRMSKPCIGRSLTIRHIIQADDVSRSEYLFLDRAIEDPLHPLPHTPLPSCSTFSPGSSEVGECGWVYGGNEEGVLPAGLAGGWVPHYCHCPSKRRFTFPLWSQPVSRRASQAAAESGSLWRKWRLQELDQTLPTADFLLGGGAGFTRYRRQDDSWLVSFSGWLRSNGATVGFKGQNIAVGHAIKWKEA